MCVPTNPVIPGWCVSTRPQMRNCASGNLEIPGSLAKRSRPGMTVPGCLKDKSRSIRGFGSPRPALVRRSFCEGGCGEKVGAQRAPGEGGFPLTRSAEVPLTRSLRSRFGFDLFPQAGRGAAFANSAKARIDEVITRRLIRGCFNLCCDANAAPVRIGRKRTAISSICRTPDTIAPG